MRRHVILSVLCMIIMLIITNPGFSQESTVKPRIAVKKLTVSDPGNIQLEVISDRITDSTELVLKFMNEYEFDTSPGISSVETTDSSMLDYCNRNNIDNIVYGKTYIGSDNSFVIEMSVFSRKKAQTALTRIGRAETALDIFDTADRLTAVIIEEFSGVHIAFGKVHLENSGVAGSFIPYIDGEPFPENSSTIENLLIGKRTVEIRQNRMLGETSIFSTEVTVSENSAADVVFEIPDLLPAETEVIEGYNKTIDRNYDKLKRKDRVIQAFNEIDSLLSDTPWNITLEDLRADYRKKRTEYEANLAELAKKGKREFIVGASLGVNIADITQRSHDDGEDSKDNSPYDPVHDDEWNKDKPPSPQIGVNIQYQLFRNLYLQTEFNYKELYYSDIGGFENYIRITEIPVLLKLTKQFENHRFSMYMGPGLFKIEKANGIFNYESELNFTRLDVRDEDIEMIMGLEYGYKKGRHLLSAGLRYTNMNILEYSFFDVDDGRDYDMMLHSSTFELILGYGYNLGGSGKIIEEKDRNKWLFPAETGLMFMSGGSEDNTDIFAGGGALRRITPNLYAGIKLFVFSEGGAPMLSIATTKNPDKIIHNYSALVFPVMGTTVGAFEYNIGINKISLGAFMGGPLDNGLQDIAFGVGAGYYF